MRHKILLKLVVCICAFSCQATDARESIQYQVDNSNVLATIHVLTVDPKDIEIIAVRAQDMGYGLSTVATMAKHFNAKAGINGGFFRMNSQLSLHGVPAGIFKNNGQWHGIAYKPRAALGWDPDRNTVLIDIVQTESSIVLQDQVLPINAMNKTHSPKQTILLSDSFVDPVIADSGMDLLITDQKVQDIVQYGSLKVPSKGYIYYMPKAWADKVPQLKHGDKADVKIKVQPQLHKAELATWNKLPFIVGGGPLLINNGQKQVDFSREKMNTAFLNTRHSRTAVGILPDKRWVFIVAQSNILEDKPGLTVIELQDFAFNLGCIAALNLDGGSSSTMYVADQKQGAITDYPVADAILLRLRK